MTLDGTPPDGAAAPFPGSFWGTHPGAESGSASGPQLPQNIGHRGYKAAFPENSMAAFHGAVAAGAHAIETDLHLSRDGVVVLSHDASLKRCFGVDAKVADCDWSYLSTLQTLAEPRQGMPQLSDVLEWLTQPGLETVWVVLDIKTDDDPDVLMPAIARTLAAVPPAPHGRPWTERVVVGAWNEHYLSRTRLHLPSHPLLLITFSLLYAHKFLSSSDPSANADVHFSLFQPALVGPLGARFRRLARERGRRVFAWTVNDEAWMEWCVRKGVAGVITDEVERFGGVRKRFGGGETGKGSGGGGETGSEEGGKVGEGEGAGGTVVVRDGIGWPRKVRLYVKAGLLQAAAMLVSLLLWHKLSSRGGGTKGGRVVEGTVPGKV